MKKGTGVRVKGIVLILVTCYLLLVTFTRPVYAVVRFEDWFGFSDIKSLAGGTQRLVTPAFEVAAVLVVLYFLFGAFKYLKSAGNKEEIEGARQMITHAIIGFMLLMFAFFIIQFVPQFFNLPGLVIIP